MSHLVVEQYKEELKQELESLYKIIYFVLDYEYKSKCWVFTIINSKEKTLYLPFNYKKKKVFYGFYYQNTYRKLKQ